MRKIVDGEPVAQVRQQLPDNVSRCAGPAGREELESVLLVEAPDLAERHRRCMAQQAELCESAREFPALLSANARSRWPNDVRSFPSSRTSR